MFLSCYSKQKLFTHPRTCIVFDDHACRFARLRKARRRLLRLRAQKDRLKQQNQMWLQPISHVVAFSHTETWLQPLSWCRLCMHLRHSLPNLHINEPLLMSPVFAVAMPSVVVTICFVYMYGISRGTGALVGSREVSDCC